MKRLPKSMTVAVEGSSELSLRLPHNDEWRQMNYAESYLASCYAIWVAAQDDHDERAIALKNDIMGLTHHMLNEVETIH